MGQQISFSIHLNQVAKLQNKGCPFINIFYYCLTRAELCVTICVFLHSVHSDTIHSANFLVFFLKPSAMDIPIVHMGTFTPHFFPFPFLVITLLNQAFFVKKNLEPFSRMLNEPTPSRFGNYNFFFVGRTKTNGFLFLQLGVYIALEICSQALSLDDQDVLKTSRYTYLKRCFISECWCFQKSHDEFQKVIYFV